MQAVKKVFIFFFLSLMVFSMMQPELCPEAPIMQNGHQIHGLCARRANSKRAAFWPSMGCQRIMVAYPAAEGFSHPSLTPPFTQFLAAALFTFYLPATDSTPNPHAVFEQPGRPDPYLSAETLRGPPIAV